MDSYPGTKLAVRRAGTVPRHPLHRSIEPAVVVRAEPEGATPGSSAPPPHQRPRLSLRATGTPPKGDTAGASTAACARDRVGVDAPARSSLASPRSGSHPTDGSPSFMCRGIVRAPHARQTSAPAPASSRRLLLRGVDPVRTNPSPLDRIARPGSPCDVPNTVFGVGEGSIFRLGRSATHSTHHDGAGQGGYPCVPRSAPRSMRSRSCSRDPRAAATGPRSTESRDGPRPVRIPTKPFTRERFVQDHQPGVGPRECIDAVRSGITGTAGDETGQLSEVGDPATAASMLGRSGVDTGTAGEAQPWARQPRPFAGLRDGLGETAPSACAARPLRLVDDGVQPRRPPCPSRAI
mgnify:FL=1